MCMWLSCGFGTRTDGSVLVASLNCSSSFRDDLCQHDICAARHTHALTHMHCFSLSLRCLPACLTLTTASWAHTHTHMFASAGVHRPTEPPRPHHGPRLASWRSSEPRLPNRHQEDQRCVCVLRGVYVNECTYVPVHIRNAILISSLRCVYYGVYVNKCAYAPVHIRNAILFF